MILTTALQAVNQQWKLLCSTAMTRSILLTWQARTKKCLNEPQAEEPVHPGSVDMHIILYIETSKNF